VSWLPVVVTVEPESEPLTLTEAKAQCRVDGTDDDDLLTDYIETARTLVEQYTGTKLVSQTVVMRARDWCDLYDLPIAPIASVSGITYIDPDGNSQTLSTDVYETVLVGLEPLIRLKVNQSWPAIRCAADAIIVTASAGYASVPATIKHAMLLTISQWYDDRASGALPDGAMALLANYRRF
jgi:uncharacterized phiE125 gp8 family phage protein